MKHSDDNPDWERLRRRMVDEQIRRRGVHDPAVLDALLSIPREDFLPRGFRQHAYDDSPAPIGGGQTISQPYIVAFMTEKLMLSSRHRVLEVGTGSGYQTAVLARLAAHVFSIERDRSLHTEAKTRLAHLGLTNVSLLVGDGSVGLPEQAPFDRILITAAAPRVPAALVDQLAENGILIVPVGGETDQTLVRVERTRRRTIETRLLGCRFVKLVGKEGWSPL